MLPYIKSKKERVNLNIQKILNLIYPQTCGICGKVNLNSLCNKCAVQLKKEEKFNIISRWRRTRR